jgi:hypothetical protein
VAYFKTITQHFPEGLSEVTIETSARVTEIWVCIPKQKFPKSKKRSLVGSIAVDLKIITLQGEKYNHLINRDCH